MRKSVVLALVLILTLSAAGFAQTTIRLWFAGTPQALMDAMYDEMVPAFEAANPDIKLEVEFVPWSELSTKLATSFAAGVTPDIFMHGQAAIAEFVESNQLLPLDEFIADWPDKDDFGATLGSGYYKDATYFIPVFGAGRLLIYRADTFKEAGLDPDNPPTTWDELVEAAKALTVKQGNRFIRQGIDFPADGIDLQQVWAPFLWQAGGAFLTEDGTQAAFNSPEGVESLQFMVDFIYTHGASDVRTAQPVGNVSPIAADLVGMIFEVPGVLAQIKTYSPEVYPEIRVALPTKHVTQDTLYSFSGFMMSRHTVDKEKAWRVMSYLLSADSLEKINQAMATLPPRVSLAEAEFIVEDPNLKVYVEAMQFGRGNPNHPKWVQIRDIVSRYLERAMRGVMSPQEALDEAAKEVNRLLAE